MPQFVMTTLGQNAFTSAGLGGPLVDISRFRVAQVGAWTPVPSDTDLPSGIITGNGIADPAGFMPIVNYKIIAPDTGAYACRMDNTIGTFDFDSIAIYQEDPYNPGVYICVGLYYFGFLIKKQAITMTDLGNIMEISAHISVSGLANLTIQTNLVSPSPANFLELAAPDFLPIPSVAPVNAYIMNNDSVIVPALPHGLDEEGNAIFAYKKSTDIWTFGTHLHKIVDGGTIMALPAPTATSLASLAIDSQLLTMNIGQYILQMTSGSFIGECRTITISPGINEINWATAMPGVPAVGDTFDIYQSNVSWGGGGGGSGGQNEWSLVIATSGQQLFYTWPVRAEQALVFFGSAFQPPDPTVYSVVGPFYIQFVTGVPLNTRVHFVERTLDFNNVIPGGITGQALVKNSSANGDYTWQTLGFDTHPIIQALKRASLCSPYATSSGSVVGMGATLASTLRWSGGVQAPNGKIYGVPYDSDKIIVIDPYTGTADDSSDLSSGILTGTLKWFGGCLGPDGKIYCAPYNATTILVIDPEAGTASTSAVTGPAIVGSALYRGAVLAQNGKIYCVPHSATDVLIIDPIAGTYSFMGATVTEGPAAYSGGCLATFNSMIYCAPYDAEKILIIDPATDTISEVTTQPVGAGKWDGVCLGSDGYLYCVPSGYTDVLKIDPSTDTTSVLGAALPGTATKYSGGCIGSDGKMYCAPFSAANYLVVDITQQTTTAVAAVMSGTDKYVGILPGTDGVLYAIPHSATGGLLQIVNKVAPAMGFDLTLSPYLNKF